MTQTLSEPPLVSIGVSEVTFAYTRRGAGLWCPP